MFTAIRQQFSRLLSQGFDCDPPGFCQPWGFGAAALAY